MYQNIYLLHEGVSTIGILDSHSYQLRGTVWDLGFAPHAILFLTSETENERLIVYSCLSRKILAFDASENPPQKLWDIDLQEMNNWNEIEVYSDDELRGKQIFHDAKDQKITKNG